MTGETGETFGNVDVHCHVLPGLDDGPEVMEDSVEMARVALADGTTHIVATPHANYRWGYDPLKIAVLRDELQMRLGDRPRILIGCDFHLSYENIQDALVNRRKYSINGSRYQLVEFPEFFNVDSLETALHQLISVGLVPVLTHPERNPVFQQNKELALRYIGIGCVVQVTSGALDGNFGKTAQKTAEHMIDREVVHIIASDGHSATRRAPKLSDAARWLASRKGDEVAHAMVSANPRAMVLNADLPYKPERNPRDRRKAGKGFWSFLK